MTELDDPILKLLVHVVEKRDLDGNQLIHVPLMLHVGLMFIYGD